MQNKLSEYDERDAIDCAIALSLSEEDQKGKNFIGASPTCKHLR